MGMLPAFHRTLKRGDTVELTINNVAFGGAGIGRYGEMVVFVPFTEAGKAANPIDHNHQFSIVPVFQTHFPPLSAGF